LKEGVTLNHTLFVGIDIAKLTNHVFALNLERDKLLSINIPNTRDDANQIETHLLKLLEKHNLTKMIIILESTGVYSAHIASYLSSSKPLSLFNTKVYIINPKISKNYRKSFADMDKTNPKDAFILADIAKVGRCDELTPFKGSQQLVLERLTRHKNYLTRRFMP